MTHFDRDELLARTDLRALADELLGPHSGSERSPAWSCPVPTHAQTGRTPPLSIFVSRRGEERWHCHGCGASGTAIDLVVHAQGVDVRHAFEWLASRTSLQPETRGPSGPGSPRPEPVASKPRPEIEPYVAACEQQLWTRACQGPARWLIEQRGLSEDVLRLNRVGFDPGPVHLDRPDGVPRAVGVVLPVLDDDGRAIFTQTRRLGARITGPRYLNCAGRAAPNPRVAFYRSAATRGDPLIVCEGAIDALTAADAEYYAAAVLGSALADERTVAALVERSVDLVVAFDSDAAGERGAEQLEALVHERGGYTSRVSPRGHAGDLNAWRVAAGDDWPGTLGDAVDANLRVVPRSTALGLA